VENIPILPLEMRQNGKNPSSKVGNRTWICQILDELQPLRYFVQNVRIQIFQSNFNRGMSGLQHFGTKAVETYQQKRPQVSGPTFSGYQVGAWSDV